MSGENEKKSIYDGFDGRINSALKLTPEQSIDHVSLCKKFEPTDEIREGIKPLVFALYEQIENNWQGSNKSKEIWLLKKEITIGKNTKSRELILEHAIAMSSNISNLLDGWYRHLPTASGLINSTKDKHAAVDLVHLEGDQLELVELKWAGKVLRKGKWKDYKSNTPLYAIFEILRYGLVYLFCFNMREKLGFKKFEVMNVSNIILSTLAPVKYYSNCDFQWLVDDLQPALKSLFKDKSGGDLSCQFKCYAFPENFSLQFERGSEVLELKKDDTKLKTLVENLNNRSAVKWNSA